MPCGGGHNEEPEQPALRSTAREALCAPEGQDPLQGGDPPSLVGRGPGRAKGRPRFKLLPTCSPAM